MIDQQLISQIEALPVEAASRVGDSAFTAQDKAVITAAYLGIYDKPVKECSCKHRYFDALMEIRMYLKIKKRSNMKYELKAGRLIWHEGDPYSNANLTDEVAEKWCAQHADLVDVYFQRYETGTATEPKETETKLKPKKKTSKKR